MDVVGMLLRARIGFSPLNDEENEPWDACLFSIICSFSALKKSRAPRAALTNSVGNGNPTNKVKKTRSRVLF